MSEAAVVLKDIFLIFALAKLAGEIFERLRQPALIAELLVGVVIGPHAFGLVGVPDSGLVGMFHGDSTAAEEALLLVHGLLAELGVIILLFVVGLETRVSDLLGVGRRAVLVGIFGIVVPLLLGLAVGGLLFGDGITAAFLGVALVATSVGITARVLRDMGVVESREARIILGAAVIDDILGLILLAIVSGLGGGSELSPTGVIIIAAQAIGFILFTTLLGTHLVGRYSLHWRHLRQRHAPFIIAVTSMFALAVLASYVGLAAVIGAFLAGMILAEAEEEYELEEVVMPIYELLVPFFFVVIGTQLDWRLFLDPSVLEITVLVTVLAVASKVAGCSMASLGLPGRSVAIISVGMVPRGEVGLIIAGLGLSIGALPGSVFSAVIGMSILTTVITPPALRMLYGEGKRRVERPQDVLPRAGHRPDM